MFDIWAGRSGEQATVFEGWAGHAVEQASFLKNGLEDGLLFGRLLLQSRNGLECRWLLRRDWVLVDMGLLRRELVLVGKGLV